MSGWIKLHRKLIDNPIFDNAELLRVWIWCLLKASHKGYNQLVGLTEVELKEGQFITGRFSGSKELRINPSTFYKYLKTLEKLKMIELNSNNKMTIVTIAKWAVYQLDEIESYQQNNNNVSTTYQQNNTNKNDKNDKNEKELYKDIVEYLNEKTNKSYKHSSKATQRLIDARLNEGFTIDDFKKVIDNKTKAWINDSKMNEYLRPQTLFGTKFESYLNEGGSNGKPKGSNDEYAGIGFTDADLRNMQW